MAREGDRLLKGRAAGYLWDMASATGHSFNPDTILRPRLRRAYEWWRAIAPEGRPPDRARFDPLDIADLMPDVVMWDVLPEGGYRCRLAGTRMVEIHGRELTGLGMAELHGADNATIQPEYDGVVRTGLPHYVERTMYWMKREHRRYGRILLPFSAGGAAVAIVMNVADFDPIRSWFGGD